MTKIAEFETVQDAVLDFYREFDLYGDWNDYDRLRDNLLATFGWTTEEWRSEMAKRGFCRPQ